MKFFIVLFLGGCAMTIMRNPWPQPAGVKWYVPEYYYQQDEAVSILKTLSAGGFANGQKISGVDVDKYIMLINMKWQEIYSTTDYTPSYGGFFIGWNYIPVYSGSYQTSNIAVDKSINVSVSFREIKDIQIMGESVYLFEESKSTVINCGNAVTPQRAADAVRSMMRINGVSLAGSFGFSFAEVNKEQAEYSGRSGIYIASVFDGGPAQKAGIEVSDIILEINSRKIEKIEECAAALKAAALSGKKIDILVLNTKVPEGASKILWEKRLASIKPATR